MTVPAALPDPSQPGIIPLCAVLGSFLAGAVARAFRRLGLDPARAALEGAFWGAGLGVAVYVVAEVARVGWTSMRADSLVPAVVGTALCVAVVLGGPELGWSKGAVGTAAVGAAMIGVLLRLFMHDVRPALRSHKDDAGTRHLPR